MRFPWVKKKATNGKNNLTADCGHTTSVAILGPRCHPGRTRVSLDLHTGVLGIACAECLTPVLAITTQGLVEHILELRGQA